MILRPARSISNIANVPNESWSACLVFIVSYTCGDDLNGPGMRS